MAAVDVPLPTKKRRFFVEDPTNSTALPHTYDEKPTSSSVGTSPRSMGASSQTEPSELEPETFNVALVESMIGTSLSPTASQALQKASGDNMDRAVNMYLDGSWHAPAPLSRQATMEALRTPPAAPSPPMAERRYLGAFGVSGWTTASGRNLVQIGEAVKIERSRIRPPSNAGKMSAARQRTDIIVRFSNMAGAEIGRLPQDTAEWVSTLMDQRICHFEAVCFYAPERLRINETVELQLRCYMLRRAFDSNAFLKPQDSNRTTGIFEERETSEEKSLRTRQVAMVKLFTEIDLKPNVSSDMAEAQKRERLLIAAEKVRSPPDTPNEDEQEDGQELQQDQLDSLYKKAQCFDFDTPVLQPADTFTMDLRKYQKQALYWMVSKERDQISNSHTMHPLWEEYAWPEKDLDDQTVEGQPSFYVNPYSGEISLDFPAQEQHCLGGILADEMGLGKTIEMLSLVHTNPSSAGVATTLVVAPMSLLAQWDSEVQKASAPRTLKSLVYYGSDKSVNLRSLCQSSAAPGIIITSYGIVLSEFNQVAKAGGDRKAHGGLFSLDFHRVILDEAHFIKNRQSKTARACYELAAQHRWVLTGTPIVNRLEDLFSLVHFLRVEPWANFSFWKTFITVPFESQDFIRALDVVQTVLEPLVIRRTKDMKTPDGESLVPLPPRTIDIEEIELSKQEREVYDYIFTRAKRTLNATMEAGTLLKSYTTIFAQLLRLRQSCCHPVLTRNKAIVADEEEAAAASDVANGLADDMDLQELIERFTTESQDVSNKFGANVLRDIQNQEHNECPICSEEPMVEPAVTGCWHSACKQCLLDYIQHQKDKETLPLCFNCREPINQRDIFEIIHHDNGISLSRLGQHSSAKIVALLAHLKALRNTNPGTKSVVFSQFTSFLDLIADALEAARIPFLRFDGAMSQKARASVLTQFSAPSEVAPNIPRTGHGVVLLLSLRAGGVGLNLTCAKRVFMMDPWWSFAVEAQAIDRVHRMGQDEAVKVVRFVVAESIEQRMLKVQDRKKFISLGMMSEEERKMQRIEDIKELLS